MPPIYFYEKFCKEDRQIVTFNFRFPVHPDSRTNDELFQTLANIFRLSVSISLVVLLSVSLTEILTLVNVTMTTVYKKMIQKKREPADLIQKNPLWL